MSGGDARDGAADEPRPVELLVVPGGYALAWSAPWGAAATVLRRFAPEYARPSLALSTTRGSHTPPRLFHVAIGMAALWCEDDGTWLAVVSADGTGFVRAPRRILEGGRTLAVAPGRRLSHAFVEDGEQVRVITIDARGEHTLLDEPLLVQTGRVRLAAARAGDAPLLIAAYAGDRRLVVADGARGRGSLSRHDLPAACRALDAYGAGGRAAFAIAYDDGEVVEAGVVDAAGKLVERRHAVLREPGALYSHVRTTWIEEDFHVVARDARHDRATVVAVGATRRVFSLSRVQGPFAVAYHGKRFVLAQALARADDAVLQLARSSQAGAEPTTSEVRQPPPAALHAHRAARHVERCVAELERALGGAGYRDARSGALRAASGGATTLRLDPVRLVVELRPDGDRFRLVAIALREGVTEPARDGSAERLARWVRERISPAARDAAARERAIGARLAEAVGGELAHVERNASGRRHEIHVTELPPVARLVEWVRLAGALLAAEEPLAPAPAP